MAKSTWRHEPNFWLYHFGQLVMAFYAQSRSQAKAIANNYVNEKKRYNKLTKVKAYKKDFTLRQSAKGANDA